MIVYGLPEGALNGVVQVTERYSVGSFSAAPGGWMRSVLTLADPLAAPTRNPHGVVQISSCLLPGDCGVITSSNGPGGTPFGAPGGCATPVARDIPRVKSMVRW